MRDLRTRYAEVDHRATEVAAPNDTYFASYQCGMTKIQAADAWGITTGSAAISVAILDTGVESDHQDLAGKVTDNYNFTGSATSGDVDGHGTHVAGIAAANTNNGKGVAGIGYNSTIINVKVVNARGLIGGVQVTMNVVGPDLRTWSFKGQTDNKGMVNFVINKAPKGSYTATVTKLYASVNPWDTTKGITYNTYTRN